MTVVERVGSSVVQHFEQPPLYRLDSGVPPRREFTVEEAQQQPSLLLNAQHQQIEFIGRSSELQSLRTWRQAENPASVLLLHGPAGQGKSRLATQFARESRQEGWAVVQARHGSDHTSNARAVDSRPGPLPAAPPESEDLLLILDYAERWPSQDLISFMNDCVGQTERNLRVLLIARPASGWWISTLQHVRGLGIPHAQMLLPPLTAEVDRKALFKRARDHFGSALGAGSTEYPRTPRDLSGEGFSTVLAIHMAALTEVDALRLRRAPPSSPAEISEYLLGREYAHWEKLLASERVKIPPAAFAQTVYTATLTGALPYEQGLEAVSRIGIESAEHGGQIIKDHALAYPSQRPDAVLEPLYPDLLGEDFIAFLLPDDISTSSLLADRWTVGALTRLISDGTTGDTVPELGQADPWTRRALITLIESARRWQHVASRQLLPLLTTHPTLVQQAGPAALAALISIKSLPLYVLDAFESSLPYRDAEIDAGSVELARHLAPYRLRRAHSDEARAKIHGHLAFRLLHAGQFGEAAQEIEKAVLIYERLAHHDRSYLPVLAFNLDLAGIIYFYNGNKAQALDATRRSVNYFTALVKAGLDEYRHALGRALANLTGRELLDPEAQRSYGQTAVDIGRELAGDDPTCDRVELAGSLHNLGLALSALARHDEALCALREAADIRRAQAGRDYGFYADYLHLVLGALTDQLILMEHLDEARDVAREHVTLLRDLAGTNPALYAVQFTHAEATLESLTRPSD